MVTIDTAAIINTYAPPTMVAADVAHRVIWGLSLNEWFYVCAILCMLMSNVATTIKALRQPKGETNVNPGKDPA